VHVILPLGSPFETHDANIIKIPFKNAIKIVPKFNILSSNNTVMLNGSKSAKLKRCNGLHILVRCNTNLLSFKNPYTSGEATFQKNFVVYPVKIQQQYYKFSNWRAGK